MAFWIGVVLYLAVLVLLEAFAPALLHAVSASLVTLVVLGIAVGSVGVAWAHLKSRRVARIHKEIAAATGDPLCHHCGHLLKLHDTKPRSERTIIRSLCSADGCSCTQRPRSPL